MLEELVVQPHCTHVLVKVAIKYVYTTSFTVFGAVHFLMRIMFVTSITNQRR